LSPTPEIDEWLHSERVPAFATLPHSDAFDHVSLERENWLSTGDTHALATASRAWTTQEWLHFIDALPRDLSADRLVALDDAFSLTSSTNAEIAHVWFRLAIAAGYTSALPAIERYLLRIGRRKLIVPLYRDLTVTLSGKLLAARIYAQARPGYHPLAQSAIDALVPVVAASPVSSSPGSASSGSWVVAVDLQVHRSAPSFVAVDLQVHRWPPSFVAVDLLVHRWPTVVAVDLQVHRPQRTVDLKVHRYVMSTPTSCPPPRHVRGRILHGVWRLVYEGSSHCCCPDAGHSHGRWRRFN
jgi:hypothetical protein